MRAHTHRVSLFLPPLYPSLPPCLSLSLSRSKLIESEDLLGLTLSTFPLRKFRRALLWLCCERRRRHARLEEWKDLVNNRQPIRYESPDEITCSQQETLILTPVAFACRMSVKC